MTDTLQRAVREDAAIRRVRRLQPAGGAGDKLFPPTYPADERNGPPRHVFETRRIDGVDRKCVLIDSVQSQANRLEEGLLRAARAGRCSLPRITVDFSGTDLAEIGEISTLEAPHRVFDAIVRDAEVDGKAFRNTASGSRLLKARMNDATALFELSPTALVFGAWNSTGGGGLGAKFPRCLVSEIVGVGAALGERTSSRIDPLGIRRDVEVWKGEGGAWDVDPKGLKKAKKVRPSEINHGNIAPSVVPLGVTIDYALHTVVVSFAGLRRLSFPSDGRVDDERDIAARTVLATLALLAVLEQDAQGYALRSRCDLVCDGAASFEFVHPDGSVKPFDLDVVNAAKLLVRTVEEARRRGLTWDPAPLRLTPQPRLVEIVRRSREKALAGEGEEGGEAAE